MRRLAFFVAAVAFVAAACSLDWTFVEPSDGGAEGGADASTDGSSADARADADGGDGGCQDCVDASRYKCGDLECIFPGGICVVSDASAAFACATLRGCRTCDCVDGGGLCLTEHTARFVSCAADGGGVFVTCQ